MSSDKVGLGSLPGDFPVPGRRLDDGRMVVCKPDWPGERSALCRLRENGFCACPEFMGLGREGEACYALPLGKAPPSTADFSEKQFLVFMRLLRRMHDAGAAGGPEGELVICHHNLSPENVLFDPPYGYLGSLPCAIVGWDHCHNGRRWEDVAFACWLWLKLGEPGQNDEESLTRLSKGLLAYAQGEEALYREIARDFDDRLCVRMEAVAFQSETQGRNCSSIRKWATRGQDWVFTHRAALRMLLDPDKMP